MNNFYFLRIHRDVKRIFPNIKDFFDFLIQPSLEYIIKTEHLPEVLELSISIVSDHQIKKINKKYRNINYPTDVLSFSQVEGFKIPRKNQPYVLGDIIISYETAQRQAEKIGHSLPYELLRLYVHGLYHLLGYDHEKSKEDEKIMFHREKKLFQYLKNHVLKGNPF